MPQYQLSHPYGHLILVMTLEALFTKFVKTSAYFMHKRFRLIVDILRIFKHDGIQQMKQLM